MRIANGRVCAFPVSWNGRKGREAQKVAYIPKGMNENGDYFVSGKIVTLK